MKLGYGQTSERDPGFASGWQALVATYGTAIVAFVVGIVFAYVAATAYAVFVRPPSGTTLLGISLVTLQGAAFPLVAYLYLRWRGLNRSFLRVSWPSISDLAWVVGGYVVAFGSSSRRRSPCSTSASRRRRTRRPRRPSRRPG
ncbi:hypothetical protein [Halospeciosus flavus]|uniref:hypothetical protein n=1 Tax=Halospeciosus flavus TaxID=3032283 RepID=UPI003621EDC4